MIIIKPHHYMDIIKLYGSGITKFVPDKVYKHSFYLLGNKILEDKNVIIKLTVDGDDICSTCQYINVDKICDDTITHIEGISSKDEWNKILDKRILKYSKLNTNDTYSSHELCKRLFDIKDNIFDIWKEDELEKTNLRYKNFCEGVKKYLNL